MRVLFNLFCQDIEAQMRFYAQSLGLPELPQRRSPIYRALDAGQSELGFNDAAAYELLALPDRQPAPQAPPAVTGYATFLFDSAAEVDAAVQRAIDSKGGVIKPPYQTYYGEWQAVLHDPEHNVFRVSAPIPARGNT